MTDLQECIGGMEMEKFYLGFDAGTQSVKVTVYNEKMECVASTSADNTDLPSSGMGGYGCG